jgi:hypothetical protein
MNQLGRAASGSINSAKRMTRSSLRKTHVRFGCFRKIALNHCDQVLMLTSIFISA